MRKIKFLLMFGLFLYVSLEANAYDFESGGIYYNITSSSSPYTVEVTHANYSGTYYSVVNIPSNVAYNGKTYSVTSIGDYAFCDCSGLTSITIPNSVTSIGELAFISCSGLTSINIPNSVTSIGEAAFSGCSGLTSINIPNSVTSIGDYAFSGCNGLTSVTIGNSVTSIGEAAFSGCSGLTSINIPNSVTSIGEAAFSGCSGLTSIVVASGNTKYDSRDNCNAIIEKSTNTLIAGCKTTIIPNSVTSIGYQAFSNCSGLTSIEIPNSVTSIGDYAFWHCSGLTSIEIPNSVTSIGNYAFSGCSGLTSIEIPNSVTSIGNYAFSGCSGLTSVTIPNSVTSIGEQAFRYCSGLTSIKVHWKRPLSVTADVFDKVDKAKCTLYVPKGTEMLYWVAPVWSEFTNIVEYDEPEDVSYYITINGLEGGEIMQKVNIGMTYSYKFKPYEEWEINSVTFNGQDVTSQLHDGIYSTPAISGNSTLSVVYKKGASGVKSVADDSNVKVFASSRAISIAGATAKSNVSIYSTDGKLLKSAHGNARFTMDNTGVYIVKVDNEVFKVSL